MMRILNGGGANWLHGHHGGNAGLAYYEGFKTANQNNVSPNTDWVVMCGSNDGSQLLLNGVDVGTAAGGSGGVSLFVNGGTYGHEKSDFAIAEVVVWPRGLTDDEMRGVSEHINNRIRPPPSSSPSPSPPPPSPSPPPPSPSPPPPASCNLCGPGTKLNTASGACEIVCPITHPAGTSRRTLEDPDAGQPFSARSIIEAILMQHPDATVPSWLMQKALAEDQDFRQPASA
jgi:hypothetical protein